MTTEGAEILALLRQHWERYPWVRCGVCRMSHAAHHPTCPGCGHLNEDVQSSADPPDDAPDPLDRR